MRGPAEGSDRSFLTHYVPGLIAQLVTRRTRDIEGQPKFGSPVVHVAFEVGEEPVKCGSLPGNLVAGAAPGPDGQFGTADDVVLGTSDAPDAISQIGAIVIKGTVQGNLASPAAHYGFVAQEVTSPKVGTRTIILTPGPNNDHLVKADGLTVTVNEV